MNRFLSFLAAAFILVASTLQVKAQVSITTPDTTLCPGIQYTINATTPAGTTTPTYLSLSDDIHSAKLNIGFDFTFYGNAYSKCVLSSNGYLSFDTLKAGTYSPFTINPAATASGAIPGNTAVYNSICGYYKDLNPVTSGSIYYTTVGTAPNRKFIAGWCDVAMYGCTSNKATFQIILYETSNKIEVHISNAPGCLTWSGGYAIEGLQNSAGTTAHPVAGRNCTIWTTTNSSHEFIATSTTAYQISPIVFAPIYIGNPGAITWVQGTSTTVLATGPSLTFTTPNSNTFYVARSVYCGDTSRDTFHLTIGAGFAISSITPTNPAICGGLGSLKLNGLEPNTTYEIHYSKGGVAQPNITLSSDPTGVVTLFLPSGNYSNIIAFKGLCFSNTVGPVQLLDPAVIVNYNYQIKYGCGQDTVIFSNISSTPGGLTYKWDFGDGTGDTAKNPTHVYTSQAIFNAKLVVTNGACTDSMIQQIDLVHPLDASFTVSKDSICQNNEIFFNNTSVTTTRLNIQPTYFWDFGDGLTSTDQNPAHLYPHAGVYRVKLVVKDFVPCYDSAFATIVVDSIPFVKYTVSDSIICAGQAITFTGDYLKLGFTDLTWDFGDASDFNNWNPISHAFEQAGTYTIKLTSRYRICPDTSFSRDITVKPFVSINLGPDTSICPNGDPIIISSNMSPLNPAAKIRWNTGDSTQSILARHHGIYSATVNLNGCTTADSMEIFKDCYLDIPNAFSPNSDGENDYFLPRQLLSKGAVSFHMTIFNRWGQKIFETTRLDGRGWDGRLNGNDQPTGVYIYMIEASFKNGGTEKYQGNVTLLR